MALLVYSLQAVHMLIIEEMITTKREITKMMKKILKREKKVNLLHYILFKAVDSVDQFILLSLLILLKSAQEKIVYLKTLSMDKEYTDMIKTLEESDKVGNSLKITGIC